MAVTKRFWWLVGDDDKESLSPRLQRPKTTANFIFISKIRDLENEKYMISYFIILYCEEMMATNYHWWQKSCISGNESQ